MVASDPVDQRCDARKTSKKNKVPDIYFYTVMLRLLMMQYTLTSSIILR